MRRNVKAPRNVSTAIGGFGLSRDVLKKTLLGIHELADSYQKNMKYRVPQDERLYQDKFSVKDGVGKTHLFTVTVDDSISPDDLFIETIQHLSR